MSIIEEIGNIGDVNGDPTQSFYHPLKDVVSHTDQHLLNMLERHSADRSRVNEHLTRLTTIMTDLNEDIPRLQSDEMTRDEFISKYRDALVELEELWGLYSEEFAYIVGSDEHFTPLAANIDSIPEMKIEDMINTCKKSVQRIRSLNDSVKNVKLSEMDVILTKALQLNELYMKSLTELVKEASSAHRRTIANQVR